MNKDKVLEALRRGMSTEIWGRNFYKQAVERTQSDAGKRVFQSLVDEEETHLDILRGEYAAVSGQDAWVSREEAQAMAASVDPTEIFPEAASAGQLIPPDATDEQALKLAMDFEQRGYQLYTEIAGQADSAEAAKVWKWLAQSEDQHYAFLQETLEFLQTNGTWYFDDKEKPIFYD
jgi:rubrerythrin